MHISEANHDQRLAFAFTLGVHAIALVLAIVCTPRYAMKPAGDEGSSLAVVILNSPQAPQPRTSATLPRRTADHKAESQAPATSNPPDEQSSTEPVVEQQQSVDSDSQQPAAISAAQLGQQQSSQPVPASNDPLAELRRLRAEAERQRQVDGIAERQAQDARTRAVLTEATSSGFIPTSSMVMFDDREQPQWFPASYPAAYAFDADNVWTFAYDLRPTHCPRPLSHSRNDATDTADRIDCLLDAAARYEASRMMHGMTLATAAFAPTLASTTKPGFVIWR